MMTVVRPVALLLPCHDVRKSHRLRNVVIIQFGAGFVFKHLLAFDFCDVLSLPDSARIKGLFEVDDRNVALFDLVLGDSDGKLGVFLEDAVHLPIAEHAGSTVVDNNLAEVVEIDLVRKTGF